MSPITDFLSTLKSGEGLKGQLLRGGIGSLGIKIASTTLSFILAIVLARLLGTVGFGVYSFVFAVVTILAIPAQMGLPNLVVRETAKAQAAGRWDIVKSLWRWSTLVALGMSLVLVVAGALAAFLLADRFTPLHTVTFAWALILVPLVALGNLRGAALRGLRYVVLGQLPEFILRPVIFIALALGGAWLLGPVSLDASSAMMLQVVAALIAFGAGILLLNRTTPRELKSTTYASAPKREWVSTILPLATLEGSQILSDNIGLIALGVLGRDEDVGILRICMQISGFVILGLTAANMTVSPHIARANSAGQLQKLAEGAANMTMSIALPISFALIVLGYPILGIVFGAGYSAGYFALCMLVLGQLVNASTGCVGALLYMTGRERLAARSMIISMLVNVALTFLLASWFGLNGAAAAGSVSVIVWNILMCRYVRRELNVRSFAYLSSLRLPWSI